MTEVNKGIRIINYAVDITCIVIVSDIINLFLNSYYTTTIYYLVFVVYYFLLEFYFGQTVGKLITKTIVVDRNNNKPNFRKLLFRTILRLNPFDGFSYLFGQEQGGHDLISKTRLKNK